MEFELTWVEPSLVICRTSGVASVEDYGAMMRALSSEPQFRPGVEVITDHTDLDASALTATEIEQLAGLRAQFGGAVAARSAMVVGPGSPMRYGLGRMFEAYVDARMGTEIRVFGTLEEAMVWLRGADSPVP